MSDTIFNEAEQFLLGQWADARALEKSLDSVRGKYAALIERVAATVAQAHPEFDASRIRVIQSGGSGYAAFFRTSWPEGNSATPPGMWIDAIRLDRLAKDDGRPPTASVWVCPKALKSIGLNALDVHRTLLDAARDVYTTDEFNAWLRPDLKSDSGVFFAIPAKAELLALLSMGKSDTFVELMIETVDRMARLLPAMDRLLGTRRD